MCELSDRVVRQVDVPASVQLAHASSALHGLGPVQTTAAGGGSVVCFISYTGVISQSVSAVSVPPASHAEIVQRLSR